MREDREIDHSQRLVAAVGLPVEEGTADRYDGARYGEFRVDPLSGEAVLVGLADEALSELGRTQGRQPISR